MRNDLQMSIARSLETLAMKSENYLREKKEKNYLYFFFLKKVERNMDSYQSNVCHFISLTFTPQDGKYVPPMLRDEGNADRRQDAIPQRGSERSRRGGNATLVFHFARPFDEHILLDYVAFFSTIHLQNKIDFAAQ